MKKILVVLFMFCQFSFFVEALDDSDAFEEAIELDKLDEINEIDEVIEAKNFYEIEYDDLFFEIGILFNLYNKEYNPRAIYGMGFESKYEDSYTIFQNCFDLVYIENNIDFVWTPTFFLGNSIIKIGVGTPLGIGGYIYGDNLFIFIDIGVRPSIKLTIGFISFEAYYQHLTKWSLGTDYTIDSDEFGLTLKISMDALIDIIE